LIICKEEVDMTAAKMMNPMGSNLVFPTGYWCTSFFFLLIRLVMNKIKPENKSKKEINKFFTLTQERIKC
jgi:hypothetical protein